MKSLLKMSSLKTMSEVIDACEMIVENKVHFKDECVFEARDILNNYRNY